MRRNMELIEAILGIFEGQDKSWAGRPHPPEGMDQLRGRRAGHDRAVDGDWPWARNAPSVEDGGVLDAEG